LKRTLLSRKALKPATPFHAIRVIPSRSGSEVHEFGKEVLPGTEKRTVIDLTRKQPEYESPYAGPAVNPNTSGFDESYDLWWDDGIQREYTYNDDVPWISAKETAQWTLYFLGWAISIYTVYKLFIRPPPSSIHPLAAVTLKEDQRAEAIRLREQRLRDMKKYNIE